MKRTSPTFMKENERVDQVFYKAYRAFNGLQAFSATSMQVDEVAKECLPFDSVATLFYRTTVILLEPQFS